MSSKNLHKIMGARYQHVKPLLCPRCKHRRNYGEWEGYCEARHKILSAANAKVNPNRQRCEDFEAFSSNNRD